jgi:hypothetical protein
MSQLISDLEQAAKEYAMDGRWELYRRCKDEIRRLKIRQEEVRKGEGDKQEQDN